MIEQTNKEENLLVELTPKQVAFLTNMLGSFVMGNQAALHQLKQQPHTMPLNQYVQRKGIITSSIQEGTDILKAIQAALPEESKEHEPDTISKSK